MKYSTSARRRQPAAGAVAFRVPTVAPLDGIENEFLLVHHRSRGAISAGDRTRDDLFVKYMAFFAGNVIDFGVEILLMTKLSANISSGIGYYERELYRVLRQDRDVPAAPLVLLGVAPQPASFRAAQY